MIDNNKVKKDHILAMIDFVKVNSASPNSMTVTNVDTGLQFEVNGHQLIQACLSADVFETEEKVTMTRLAEEVISSYNIPITVCFDKQPDKKTGKVEERIMRCRLIRPEPLLGRSLVIDLDLPANEHRERQLDHRTLKWLIKNGTKFVKK